MIGNGKASDAATSPNFQTFALTLLAAFLAVLVWSAVRPYDYFTWFLEVIPDLIVLPVLVLTFKKFPLTKLLYILIFLHMLILVVGGHYTYAREPVFNWIRDHWHLSRNYYDRVGHFAQGFVPAIAAREILLRRGVVKRGMWLSTIVVCICLAISASYELFEWRVAVATGTKSDDFLGTQGDPWDTQEDMATALVGAIVAIVTLSKKHDQELGESAGLPCMIQIVNASSPQQIAMIRELFLEYAQSLDFNLCFQSFDEELASLPGRYAPPKGRLLLALSDGKAAGCVALRDLGDGICEMKRLYVRQEQRGTGLGIALAKAVIRAAREIGYSSMRLDTVIPQMEKAVSMYRRLGFYEIAAYTANPIAGALYLELKLQKPDPNGGESSL